MKIRVTTTTVKLDDIECDRAEMDETSLRAWKDNVIIAEINSSHLIAWRKVE